MTERGIMPSALPAGDYHSNLPGVYYHFSKAEWRLVYRDPQQNMKRCQKTYSVRKYGFYAARSYAEDMRIKIKTLEDMRFRECGNLRMIRGRNNRGACHAIDSPNTRTQEKSPMNISLICSQDSNTPETLNSNVPSRHQKSTSPVDTKTINNALCVLSPNSKKRIHHPPQSSYGDVCWMGWSRFDDGNQNSKQIKLGNSVNNPKENLLPTSDYEKPEISNQPSQHCSSVVLDTEQSLRSSIAEGTENIKNNEINLEFQDPYYANPDYPMNRSNTERQRVHNPPGYCNPPHNYDNQNYPSAAVPSPNRMNHLTSPCSTASHPHGSSSHSTTPASNVLKTVRGESTSTCASTDGPLSGHTDAESDTLQHIISAGSSPTTMSKTSIGGGSGHMWETWALQQHCWDSPNLSTMGTVSPRGMFPTNNSTTPGSDASRDINGLHSPSISPMSRTNATQLDHLDEFVTYEGPDEQITGFRQSPNSSENRHKSYFSWDDIKAKKNAGNSKCHMKLSQDDSQTHLVTRDNTYAPSYDHMLLNQQYLPHPLNFGDDYEPLCVIDPHFFFL